MDTRKGKDVHRDAKHQVNDLFVNRWSPRAMSGEPVTEAEANQLLEAARWAPSSYNSQPWRFFYVLKGDDDWDTYFELLGEFNQAWAKNAGMLVVMASTTKFDHNDETDPTHEFAVGAAFENFALQGTLSGLVVHGMAGFDYGAAKEELGMPSGWEVIAMTAVGKPGDISVLPEEMQEREKPSGRHPVEDISVRGTYRG